MRFRRMHRATAGLLPAVLCASALMGRPALAGGTFQRWTAADSEISEPLNGLRGDARRGRRVVVSKHKGNCVACHPMPIRFPEQAYHGNLAPPLQGVASRYSEGGIRLRVVDFKQIDPETLMPSFHKDPERLREVAEAYRGKTILTAQEVEDVVAFLLTLD